MDWDEAMRGARYHEAGHAVAAYHHGYTIKGVTVTEEEWRADYRRSAFGGPSEHRRDACVTLTGQFADMLAGWGEIRPEPWGEFLEGAEVSREEVEAGYDGLPDDHLSVLKSLEALSADPYEKGSLEDLYNEVVADARELVSEHWSEVEAVVRALERNGRLDGADVVKIIESAS
jgi:hypothetical protein